MDINIGFQGTPQTPADPNAILLVAAKVLPSTLLLVIVTYKVILPHPSSATATLTMVFNVGLRRPSARRWRQRQHRLIPAPQLQVVLLV
jgi:hypothetical protein